MNAAVSPAEETGEGAGDGRIWQSTARGAGDQPPAVQTYSQLIAGHRDLPGLAVLAGAASCTWPQLLGRASSAVHWLAEIGAAPGRPVAALVTTTPDAIALTLAGAAAGRPPAPLGPRLTERELVPCVRGIEAGLLVAEPEYAELGERVARAAGARLAVLPEFAVAPDIDLPTPDMADIATILHTSGTTGLPKPVPMSQRMLDTLRVLQYGSSPIHPDTLRRALAELPDVAFIDIYGQTEGSPISCLTVADHLRAAAGTPTCWSRSAGPFPASSCESPSQATTAWGSCWPAGRTCSGTPMTGGSTPGTSAGSTRTVSCTWSAGRAT